MAKNRRQRAEPQDDFVALLTRVGAPIRMKTHEMIEALEQEGYRVIKEDPTRTHRQVIAVKGQSSKRWAGAKTLRFGVVSDTQLGSRKQQLTFLHMTYDRFQQLGINAVFHCGDLVDGDGKVYPGQEYDLFLHGFDRQLEYAAEHYPRRDGITTYVIAGNHDWSFYQRKGADILASLEKRRSDIRYLGPMSAQVVMDGLKIQLIHLKGGVTYARSYKLQKIIEQVAPEQKPHLLFAGDRHSWAHIPMYRNVYGWQMGCFQAQTEYEKRLGLYPELGGLIVEVDYGSEGADVQDGRRGIVAIRHEIIPFYVPKAKDY